MRVIVPEKLKQSILQELHAEHPGISRMRSLGRSYVWWPGLDKDINAIISKCLPCQSIKHTPPVSPLYPWSWPSRPWQRIHLDFAGPFQKNMFLVAVDAFSKWPEVRIMSSTSAEKTIDVLRDIFSTHGLPEQVVTDNGPQFTSQEFANFMKLNGIRHTKCAPYHPASNGLVERFNQTFKQALKASLNDGRSLPNRLSSFLLTYRSTANSTTGVSPSTLLMNRNLRTRLDLIKPDLVRKVASKQASQKAKHDVHAKARELFTGQDVMVRNLRDGPKWVPGVIIERTGPVSYLVEMSNGMIWKRHIDQIRGHNDELSEVPLSTTPYIVSIGTEQHQPYVDSPSQHDLESPSQHDLEPPSQPNQEPPANQHDPVPQEVQSSDYDVEDHVQEVQEPIQEPERRYPQRVRKPPDRLNL